jgi:ABC-2 type transport system permease protein
VSRRAGIIGAIIRKDLIAFTRDRFYVLITVLGLVFYVAMYWFLPDSVDETIEAGIHWPGGFPQELAADDGLAFTSFESSAALEAAVDGSGDTSVPIGLDFPGGFTESVRSGTPATVRVLLTTDVPDEYRGAMTSFVRELAFLVAGEDLPVTQLDTTEVILGEDRAGDQVTLQEKMGPMFVFFVLVIETFALAALVAAEIQARTVTAVLATPTRISDFLAAKALIGTVLAFGEALLLVVLIGILGTSPLVLIISLLLGALLVTGFGMIAGSSGKDFIGIVFWSMLFMIPLAIPAIAVLFPGSAAPWVRILPSYGLIDSIVRATSYGDGLADLVGPLLLLAGWCVVAFAAGLFTLRRKVASL